MDAPRIQEDLLAAFPALRDHPFEVTGPATEDYNCFAHAVGRADVFAWPEASSWWLADLPREGGLECLVAGLRLFGYERCASGDLESGFEKVCIYAIGTAPQHLSRQLPSGE